jgi:hypothetical protein
MNTEHTWTRAKAQSSHWSNLICEGSEIVATVNGTGYPTGIGWSPVSEQRAQLMAAAPDLLAALHKVQDWLEGCSTRETMQAQVARAITKATGEDEI